MTALIEYLAQITGDYEALLWIQCYTRPHGAALYGARAFNLHKYKPRRPPAPANTWDVSNVKNIKLLPVIDITVIQPDWPRWPAVLGSAPKDTPGLASVVSVNIWRIVKAGDRSFIVGNCRNDWGLHIYEILTKDQRISWCQK